MLRIVKVRKKADSLGKISAKTERKRKEVRYGNNWEQGAFTNLPNVHLSVRSYWAGRCVWNSEKKLRIRVSNINSQPQNHGGLSKIVEG